MAEGSFVSNRVGCHSNHIHYRSIGQQTIAKLINKIHKFVSPSISLEANSHSRLLFFRYLSRGAHVKLASQDVVFWPAAWHRIMNT
jgi:hypothetical protein